MGGVRRLESVVRLESLQVRSPERARSCLYGPFDCSERPLGPQSSGWGEALRAHSNGHCLVCLLRHDRITLSARAVETCLHLQ